MKVNEALKGAEQLNACNEVLKKLKDTFDGIIVPLSGQVYQKDRKRARKTKNGG